MTPKNIKTVILDDDLLWSVGEVRPTYCVANWLRSCHEKYKHIKTSQVLYRLKILEKQGKVKRVTGRRNRHSTHLVWELA